MLFAVLGLVQGASFAAVPELNNSVKTQALSYGVMAQLGNLGNLIGTPILLAVLSMGEIAAVLWVIIFGFITATTAHLLLARKRYRGK